MPGCSRRWTLVLVLLPNILHSSLASVPCTHTSECEAFLTSGSECLNGFCSNPFTKGGCLHNKLPKWNKLRVCHSEDPSNAAELGLCRLPEKGFNYEEIRIMTQNWEAPTFESWILQILLSEFLGIPATIEAAQAGTIVDFYDPQSRFGYGKANDYDALRRARKHKDCTKISNRDDPESYLSCAHLLIEVWMDGRKLIANELVQEKIIEEPQSLGVVGNQGWYVPKFTIMNDTTLGNYLGYVGEENRRKLAETFLRPTTWGDYCDQVSKNNCLVDDGVAKRAPQPDQRSRMFVEGLYTGHFRATEKNDCDANPTTCSGHIADFPCGWHTNVVPQTFHLDIALESDGPELTGGYGYQQLADMWAAANATNSNLIALWWTPDLQFQNYRYSDSELQRVNLPLPSQQCIDSRRSFVDACSADMEKKIGSLEGSCDDSSQILQKFVSTTLFEISNNPDVPVTRRNPAYQAVKSFVISNLRVDEIFDYWLSVKKDPWNFDHREAVCQWIADNFEFVSELIPPGFPRVLRDDMNKGALFWLAVFFGVATVLLVVGSFVVTYKQRGRKVMKYAQLEFLYLLLAGLLLVALGATLKALPRVPYACVSSVWLVNVGYTLDLIPLLVKMSAIVHLTNAAKRMKRIMLPSSKLFGTVSGLTFLVILFLLMWTLFDPPKPVAEDHITEETTEYMETVVTVSYYCDSKEPAWQYAVVAANFVCLICLTFLCFLTRTVRKELNESQTLVVMIYSKFIFQALRMSTELWGDDLGESGFGRTQLAFIVSLIFSCDVMGTVFIYFMTKFLVKEGVNGTRRSLMLRDIPMSPNESIRDSTRRAIEAVLALDKEEPFDHEQNGLEVPNCGTCGKALRCWPCEEAAQFAGESSANQGERRSVTTSSHEQNSSVSQCHSYSQHEDKTSVCQDGDPCHHHQQQADSDTIDCMPVHITENRRAQFQNSQPQHGIDLGQEYQIDRNSDQPQEIAIDRNQNRIDQLDHQFSGYTRGDTDLLEQRPNV